MGQHNTPGRFAALPLIISLGAVAYGVEVQVPSASDPLTIDGVLDDPFWQKALVLPLKAEGFGQPFPDGGEIRIAVRGKYLCVSARLPEPDRVVASSVGRNPIWWYEDLITWRFVDLVWQEQRTHSARRHFTLTVNPLGGVRLDESALVGGGLLPKAGVSAMVDGEEWGALSRSNSRLMYSTPLDIRDSTRRPLVAARIQSGVWSVEAAIPLDPPVELGIVNVERIRARRPDAPELRWQWPRAHLPGRFKVVGLSTSERGAVGAPVFHPPVVGTSQPEIGVPKLRELPTLDARWTDTAWAAATKLELRRDESNPRKPLFPTEVRLAHDGKILAVLARCMEPESAAALVAAESAGLSPDDRLQVFLSPSGANFVEFAVNPSGTVKDAIGATGPDRSSDPLASWDSHVAAHVTIDPGAWGVRLDIPLAEIAAALGEPTVPDQWKILIRRLRPARNGTGPEISSVPVMHSPTPYAPARYRPMRLLEGRAPDVDGSAQTRESSDVLLRELVSAASEVWSAEERKKLGVDKMVEQNLLARVDRIVRAERSAWESVSTKADWEQFRDRRLRALRGSFEPFPERTPLHTAITRRANYGDGFVLENVVFESRPHLLVTANLYLPEKIEGRIPAVVVVHNQLEGKTQPENQDMGMTWARNGAAVLVMDLIGGTERVQSNAWPRDTWGFSCHYSRYAAGVQLYLAGESLMKWTAWDLMRGVDMLLERPYIDPERVAIVGQPAGGGDAAAVAAALDDRIAVLVPDNFCGGTPMEHYKWGTRRYDFETASPGWGEWDSTRSLHQSVAGQFFPWFICASVAPRGFIYNMEVAWPGGVERQPPWARFKKIYGYYETPERLAEFDGFGPMPGPGETNFGAILRENLYPILQRQIGISAPAEEYHNPRPYSELMCLTPGVAAQRKPKPVSDVAWELARTRLAMARSKYAALTTDERRRRLRADLRAKLGEIEPYRRVRDRIVWSKSSLEFDLNAVSLEADDDIKIPVLLLKPTVVPSGGRLPAVLALAQAGKERFLSDRGEEVAALLRAGVAVCLADVRGVGETADNAPPWYTRGSWMEKAFGRGEGSPFFQSFGSGHGAASMELPAVEFMLGGTILGSRLKDARTVFAYLSGRPEIDLNRIVIWGDSFAQTNPRPLRFYEMGEPQVGPQIYWQAEPLGGLLALLTAFYEDRARAAAARYGLASYLSVLEDRFCYVPLDVVVPGILQIADLPDILAELAPRPVLLSGVVNGRNQLLDISQLKTELQTAYSAYRQAPENLVIREDQSRLEFARWLVRQCMR